MAKFRFPNDVVSRCKNASCRFSKEDFLLEEAHALIRRESEEIVVETLCPECAADAEKFGISAPSLSVLAKREEGRERREAEDEYVIELHDRRQKEILGMFEGALYACEVPLCTLAPEPATKMFAVFSVCMDGTEKLVPICSAHSDQARKANVKVTELGAMISRLARETRAALLYEQEQKHLALVNQFFGQCQHAQTSPKTASVHQDGGFKSQPRLVPTNSK